MKILVLSQYYLPQPLANAEVIGGLATELGRLGHDVTVVTPVADATNAPGVRALTAWGFFAKDRSSVLARLLEYGTFSVGAFVSGIRAPKPDVVIAPSPPLTLGLVGLVVARLRRSRAIYNVQDLYPEVADAVTDTPGFVRSVVQAVARFIYSRSDAVVVIDDAFIEIIQRSAPRAEVFAVANGIDTAPFEGARRSPNYLRSIGVEPDSPVVMYAGNVGRSQDLLAVAEATAESGATLVIHGGGAGLDSLKDELNRRGFRHIRFSGYVDRDQLGSVFASADLHVVPLKPGVAWASVPSKLLSVFSSCRPVVLMAEPSSPAARAVDQANGGWIVTPGAADELRDSIAAAVADLETARARGAAAGRWAAANASDRRMAADWERVLYSVVPSSPNEDP